MTTKLQSDQININDDIVITDSVIFTIEGTLTTGSSPFRIYNKSGKTRTITEVFMSVDSPPTSGSIVVDILSSGSSIFTSGSLPYISSGSYTGNSISIDMDQWVANSFITMNIVSVGASVAGSDLIIQVIYTTDWSLS